MFLAVSTVAIVLICLGWMVTRQVSGMLAELPRNTERIKEKVKAIKQFGSGSTKDQIGQMIEEIRAEFHVPRDPQPHPSERDFAISGQVVDPPAGPIVIQPEQTH